MQPLIYKNPDFSETYSFIDMVVAMETDNDGREAARAVVEEYGKDPDNFPEEKEAEESSSE